MYIIESDDKNSFDEYILKDVIAEKYEGEDIVKEFMSRKKGISKALQYAIDDARDNGVPMTREDFENEFRL